MTRTVVIEPEAHEDLSQVFAWYEETNPGIGQVFINAMRKAVARLTTIPDGSTPVPSAPTGDVVRRVFARRFSVHGDLCSEGGGLRHRLRAHEAATGLLAREIAAVSMAHPTDPFEQR